MIKAFEFPDKTFQNKEELFRELLKNEAKLLAIKKAAFQDSADKGQLSSHALLKETEAAKAFVDFKKDYIYPVINTTRYMDSHNDVHFDGIWNKSAREQNGKMFYLFDHSVKVSDVIAWPQDVSVLIKSIPWAFVGKDYAGETEALIFEISKDAIENKTALKIIDKKRPVQNSIKMRYVRVKMGINDSGKDFAIQKAYYDAKISSIVNKEAVAELGYFFGIEEAEMKQEGSMLLFGSNDATGLINTDAADKSTSEIIDAPVSPPVKTERKKAFIH